MSARFFKIAVTSGAAAITAMMLLIVLGGFRRLAASGRGEGSASGSSQDFMASTNKVALARELATRGDASAVSGLILGLRKDPDAQVRAACAEALGRIGDARSKPDLAVCLIEDEAPAVRRAIVLAIEACGMHREFGYYDVLRNRLTDEKAPEVRQEIAGVLTRLGTDDAAKRLAQAVADEDPGVRLAVVRAFANSKHKLAGQVLSQAAIDPDAAVQTEAAAALHRGGTALLPQLRDAVAGAKDAAGRLAAIRLLPRPIAPEALPVLFSALEKETADSTRRNPEVHNAVVASLASMGPAGASAIAKEAIAEEYDGTAELAAAQACARIGKAAARPIVEEIMRWRIFPDPDELVLWIETLGEIGDPCALPVLRRALAQGLDEMPPVVEKARCAIEAKCGSAVPPIVPEPGLLADPPAGPIRRMREGDMRFGDLRPTSAAIPRDGVVTLSLEGAMALPDYPANPYRPSARVELVRRNGEWDKFVPVGGINKRDHEGMILDVRQTATNLTFSMDVLCYDDSWLRAAFAHYDVSLSLGAETISGSYTGHMNFAPLSGAVVGGSYELPPHPPALPPLASGEHPRIVFRECDIAMLREKARTEFGKRWLAGLRKWMASRKTLYRTPLNWVSNWEPGCNMAVAQSFIATVFDDPLHGRRSAPLIMDRSRTPPYGGEHGERMPGAMIYYPYALDMSYRFLTPEERKEVVKNRCWLPGLYNQSYGPLAVIAAGRGCFGIPGLATLCMLREKGSFDLHPPDPAPVVLSLAGETALSTDSTSDPVNVFVAGHMPSNWVVAGPFAVGQGVDPLAPIGGCAAAKPRPDTAVPDGSGYRKFRALLPAAILAMPPPFKGEQFIELPVTPGEQYFLYAILKVETRQGCLVQASSPAGPRWGGLWFDGRAIDGDTIVVLQPGLHRVLVAVQSASCSPTFPAANPEWSMALQRRHGILKRRWDDHRKRSVETGEVEDVTVLFELMKQTIRSSIREEADSRRSGRMSRGMVGWNLEFALAHRVATGQGLDPDVPRPIPLPGETFGDTRGGSLDAVATDRDLIFLLGLAPEARLPEIVREFNRRLPPDGLARFNALEQIVAFVNYPMDLKK